MNDNFFNNLPKPGQRIHVPGGMVWCESWDVEYERSMHEDLCGVEYVGQVQASGRIVFRFMVDQAHAGMVKPNAALPEPVRELPAPPLALPAVRLEDDHE
jgi:hypothetical protein